MVAEGFRCRGKGGLPREKVIRKGQVGRECADPWREDRYVNKDVCWTWIEDESTPSGCTGRSDGDGMIPEYRGRE